MPGEVILTITDSDGNLDAVAVGGAMNDAFGRLQVVEANQQVTTRILKAMSDNIDGPISEDLRKALNNNGGGISSLAAAVVPLLALRQPAATPSTPSTPTPSDATDSHALPWTAPQQAVDGSGLVHLSVDLIGAGFTFQQDTASVPSDRFGRIRLIHGGAAPFDTTGKDLFRVDFATTWAVKPKVDIRTEQDEANLATNVYATDHDNYVKNGGLIGGFTVQSKPLNDWQPGVTVVFTWDTLNRPGE